MADGWTDYDTILRRTCQPSGPRLPLINQTDIPACRHSRSLLRLNYRQNEVTDGQKVNSGGERERP
ncbi:hypothetical protein J6590_000578 [Homalodisca vitripennis]|nr:hypothetical protein J6590_000578 [Homalodisca vitripennis]